MKVYVISLNDGQQRNMFRRYFIEKQLNDLAIDFKFWDATNASEMTAEEIEALVDSEVIYAKFNRKMSNGEVACAHSHARLYAHVAEHCPEGAIVLEDDAVIMPDFKSVIGSQWFKSQAHEIVLFSHNAAYIKRFSSTAVYASYRAGKLANTPYQTVAYYVSQTAAKCLARATDKITCVADWPIPLHEELDAVAISYGLVLHPSVQLAVKGFSASSLQEERAALQKKILSSNKLKRSFSIKYLYSSLCKRLFTKRLNNKKAYESYVKKANEALVQAYKEFEDTQQSKL